MRNLGGMATQLKSVAVPRVSMGGVPSQSQTLVDFAAELAQGQLCALRVHYKSMSLIVSPIISSELIVGVSA